MTKEEKSEIEKLVLNRNYQNRIDKILDLYFKDKIKKVQNKQIHALNKLKIVISWYIKEDKRIFKYMNEYSSASNELASLWNEKFYFLGLKDAQIYGYGEEIKNIEGRLEELNKENASK